MPKKNTRKYVFKGNKKQDDGDISDSLMSPCLQISQDIELKDIPSNGEEYLLKVMKERQNYSTVTTCNRDFSKFARNQSCFVKELPHAKAPESLKPTIEWQNIQVADFSKVRMYISRLISNRSLWPKDVINIEIDPDNIAAWMNLFENKDPKLSCVLGLHHALLDHGLEILIEMLDKVKPGSTINYKTGQWIYAFLACTRQPLLSDTTSILRNLARKCAEIRSHLNTEM
ncbi:unnamed protein product [Danaus chrysippus]|uniref:Gem-associated protein 2 n=1 Tax=Danaus chrysippus TaxID=151541 RepID=A0A8J2W654_9NEOP|nr:unnamed protein product [Danaus chrysippus]